TATYMSASLCLMAWNEAICRPKAKRPSAYSRAISSEACAPPSCSKATSTAARSSSRSASGQPCPAAPSGSAAARSKTMRACERGGSTVATVVRVTPGPFRSTRKSPARPAPPSAARTTAKSATSPSSTGILVPLRFPPSTRAVRVPALGHRKAADGRALGDPRQPALLLRVTAREEQRLAGEVDRRGERGGREASAQLLGQDAQLEVPE